MRPKKFFERAGSSRQQQRLNWEQKEVLIHDQAVVDEIACEPSTLGGQHVSASEGKCIVGSPIIGAVQKRRRMLPKSPTSLLQRVIERNDEYIAELQESNEVLRNKIDDLHAILKKFAEYLVAKKRNG